MTTCLIYPGGTIQCLDRPRFVLRIDYTWMIICQAHSAVFRIPTAKSISNRRVSRVVVSRAKEVDQVTCTNRYGYRYACRYIRMLAHTVKLELQPSA